MEHTKEPWRVSFKEWDSDDDVNPSPLCWPSIFSGDTEVCGQEGFYSESIEVDKANARRIVACVNACEGLPTEPLERLVAGGGRLAAANFIVDAMDRQLERAEAQRDQLLAALEGLLDEVAGCMCAYEMPARAVIQKVKGGE